MTCPPSRSTYLGACGNGYRTPCTPDRLWGCRLWGLGTLCCRLGDGGRGSRCGRGGPDEEREGCWLCMKALQYFCFRFAPAFAPPHLYLLLPLDLTRASQNLLHNPPPLHVHCESPRWQQSPESQPVPLPRFEGRALIEERVVEDVDSALGDLEGSLEFTEGVEIKVMIRG